MTYKNKYFAIGLLIVAATAYGAIKWLPVPKPSNNSATTSLKDTCAKLQPDVMKAVDEYNKSQKLEWKSGGATYGSGSYINLKKFYKVLYSPGLDTCIAVVIDQSFLQEGKRLTVYEESYGFYDAYTYDSRDWIDTVKHGYPYYSMNDVAQKIIRFQTATSSPINFLGSL